MAVLLFWSGRNGTKGILSSISRNTNSCNWEGIICGTSTCWGLISWRQFCGEGLGGSQGEWADHEPAVQFHAKGGQQHTSQSVASRPREVTGDPSSLLSVRGHLWSSVSTYGLLSTRETGICLNKSSTRSQRHHHWDWSIFYRSRGWVPDSWDCTAWRKESSGVYYHCVHKPDGKAWRCLLLTGQEKDTTRI